MYARARVHICVSVYLSVFLFKARIKLYSADNNISSFISSLCSSIGVSLVTDSFL